jgi:hypothetical protein
VEQISAGHVAEAEAWLQAHPGAVVWASIYDGDTGELMSRWQGGSWT